MEWQDEAPRPYIMKVQDSKDTPRYIVNCSLCGILALSTIEL